VEEVLDLNNKKDIIVKSRSVLYYDNPDSPEHSLVYRYNNSLPINGFVGWVEVDSSVLDESVGDDFNGYDNITPNLVEEQYSVEEVSVDEETGEEIVVSVEKTRMVPETKIVNGEPVTVTRFKTFKEYVGNNYKESVNKGKVLLSVGCKDKNGNRLKPLLSEELFVWIDFFGLDKIKTRSDAKALFKIETGDVF